MEKKMRYRLLLILFALLLFTQCKSTHEPLGRYCEFDYRYAPTHGFYYKDTVHASWMFYRNIDFENKWTDTLMGIFQQQNNTHDFYDGNISVDTVHLFCCAYGLRYLIIYTPSQCTFHWIGKANPNGTYKFRPNACERGLVSFAVSRLDFRDTFPESVEERYEREIGYDAGLAVESPECVLQIKSKEKNISCIFRLTLDRLPESLFFLIDALGAMIHDYSKPKYCIADEPDMSVFERFDKILIDKYAPPDAPPDVIDEF